jgi:hypothetical protein
MDASCQLHAPVALLSRKDSSTNYCTEVLVGPRAGLDAVATTKKKNPFPASAGNRIQVKLHICVKYKLSLPFA